MPSKKPTLRTYTNNETIEKFEIICQEENRTMSKQLEYIVKNYIKNYETNNGTITIANKTITIQHSENTNIN